MRTELTFAGNAGYVAWAPVPVQVRLADAAGAAAPVTVTLRNAAASVGLVDFAAAGPPAPELAVTLPVDGTAVEVTVRGRVASTADGDAAIEAVETATGTVLGTTTLMVRIRKDAETLTTAERDRFLAALFQLDDAGGYQDFRDVHTAAGDPQAHGHAGFLPWHRAFLLDIERELQRIDPSVALPYWRFDQPAPRLFTRDFIGVSATTGRVQWSAANPLQFFATDGVTGVSRRPMFTPTTQASQIPGFQPILTEVETLDFDVPAHRYAAFRLMEGNPHGYAHSSFSGSISDIPTAVKDPLFFLLHGNVDRLWAKWQRRNGRVDPGQATTFSTQAQTPPPVGHRLDDTMWPWNGVTGPPRPPTAPGGPMPDSPLTAAPGPSPKVRDMIDYQGVLDPAHRLGYDYDDVAFG